MTPSPILGQPVVDPPDPVKDPSWYGEFLLQYPANQATIPMNYPQWIRFKFDMISILRPVISELLDEKEKMHIASRQ